MRDQRSTTNKQRFPALKGRVIIDSYRGQTRLRAWPRKRGRPKSQQVRDQNAWFKEANNQAMRAAASQMRQSIDATAGTGLYPRDLIVRAMGAGLIDIIEPDGTFITYRQKFWEPIMFQGAIVRPTSAINPGVNIWNTITLPLPLVDTAGFWNAGAPTRLTIPTNIEIVKVGCNVKQNSSGGPLLATRIVMNGTTDVAWSQATSSGTVGDHVSTGPMMVSPADYFEFLVFPTRAGPFPVGPTWFAVEILQAQ